MKDSTCCAWPDGLISSQVCAYDLLRYSATRDIHPARRRVRRVGRTDKIMHPTPLVDPMDDTAAPGGSCALWAAEPAGRLSTVQPGVACPVSLTSACLAEG
ncbi:hypothetical protein ACFVY4_01335 [Streptomyces sp. NPDC058299]|uniref:hypothetical protein n=1 Tax=Streptomyces sp. NPDC058299 TaxID=3346435 RepID=UPI0036E23868